MFVENIKMRNTLRRCVLVRYEISDRRGQKVGNRKKAVGKMY